MAKNPLIRRKEKSFTTPLPNQSAGILDDFAVRKVVSTKEGTVEHTPSNDSDIVNKKFVDDSFMRNDGDTATGDYIFNKDVQIGSQDHGSKLSVGDYSISKYGSWSSPVTYSDSAGFGTFDGTGMSFYTHRPTAGQGTMISIIRGRGTLENPLPIGVTNNVLRFDIYGVTNSSGGIWQIANFQADMDGAQGKGKWLFKAIDQVTSNHNYFVVSSVTGTEFNQQIKDNDLIIYDDTAENVRVNAGTHNFEGNTTSGAWIDRKSTRLNSSHTDISRMPSSA